LYVYLENKQKL